MKAIGVREITDDFDSVEDLELPVPSVGADELLVEVHSVGLNATDYRTFASMSTMEENVSFIGVELPFVGGYDFSGVVVDKGPGADCFSVGDEVYGRIPSGGAAAEYVSVYQHYVAPKPESLGHGQAATIPIPIQTAHWFLVEKGHLQAGQYLLVLGGGGSVGSVAVMLAKELGAKVAATGFAKHAERIAEAGADVFIDVDRDGWDKLGGKVDMLLDTFGDNSAGRGALPDAISNVRDGGTVLAMTMTEMPDPPITDNQTLQWVLFSGARPGDEALLLANRLVEKGVYHPGYADEVGFSAREMCDAVTDIWEHRKNGRMVMKVK